MNSTEVLASSQLLTINPILKEESKTQSQYFFYLKKMINCGRWSKRKYVKAQMTFYRDTLGLSKQDVSKSPKYELGLIKNYIYHLPVDLASILAFHKKSLRSHNTRQVIQMVVSDFHLDKENERLIETILFMAQGEEKSWKSLVHTKVYQNHQEYYKQVWDNIKFVRSSPYRILVTATMSAGKSTFINALVGKNVSLMQNMACTSKIHTIVGQPFEDGCISEFDSEIIVDADKEDLMTDNEKNNSSKIYVGMYFNSLLAGKRIVLNDSPGINSSENSDHKTLSEQTIQKKKYDLLIYVLNATQLGTTDDEKHLEFVAQNVGRKPVLFVLNKIDCLSDDENFEDIIKRQEEYLTSKGFKEPCICPVSCRAAYLAKSSLTRELSRLEQRELDNFSDMFEQVTMAEYYKRTYPALKVPNTDDEKSRLLENSGISYIEDFIKYLI